MLMVGNATPARMIDIARLAEQSGFGTICFADERFYREVYTSLAVLAANTSTIQLGTCVTDPYSRHPAMTAAAIATLDEFSSKRAFLGIGTGLSGFAEMGVDRRKPVLAMREAIAIIRALLKGDTIDFQGEIFSFHAGKLNFAPVRADLPIHIASNGPMGQVLAGRVADGAIMEGCGTPEEAKVFVSRVRGAAREAGRDPASVRCIARLNCCIAEDSAVAHDTLRLRAAKTIAGGYMPFATLGELGLALPPEALEKVAGLPYNVGFAPYEQILPWVGDSHVEAVTLAGTAEEIARRVSAIRDSGIDNIIISPAPAPGGSVEAVIRSFAEEVWPAFSSTRPLHQNSSRGVAL